MEDVLGVHITGHRALWLLDLALEALVISLWGNHHAVHAASAWLGSMTDPFARCIQVLKCLLDILRKPAVVQPESLRPSYSRHPALLEVRLAWFGFGRSKVQKLLW